MYKLTTFLFVVLGMFAATAVGQGNAAKTDQEQILSVVRSFADAWNAADMEKFSELFTQDADWVNIRGARWRGKTAIKDEHTAIHKRFYSKSRVEFSDVTVRMVTPEVAVVHAKENVTGSDVPKEAGISPDSQMSLVIVKSSGKWLIANGQNTNIILPPPPRPAK